MMEIWVNPPLSPFGPGNEVAEVTTSAKLLRQFGRRDRVARAATRSSCQSSDKIELPEQQDREKRRGGIHVMGQEQAKYAR